MYLEDVNKINLVFTSIKYTSYIYNKKTLPRLIYNQKYPQSNLKRSTNIYLRGPFRRKYTKSIRKIENPIP
jgi:hypothetical protein